MNAKQRRAQQRVYTAKFSNQFIELRLLGASPEIVRLLGRYRPAAQLVKAISHYRNKHS